MEEIVKIPTKVYPIRFQDCDPFRHLNNSKYLDYFVNAREDHLMEYYDMNLATIAVKMGVSWVVSMHNIAYLRPAKMMEKVLIESQLIEYSNKAIRFEMRMWDIDKTEVKSVNWTELVHIDMKTQRPTDHSEHFSKLFTSIIEPVNEEHFDQRAAYFKEFNKKQISNTI